jgi:hypothetical protein
VQYRETLPASIMKSEILEGLRQYSCSPSHPCSCIFVQQFLKSQCARVSYVTLQLVNITMTPGNENLLNSLRKLPADGIVYESELDNYLQLAMRVANLINGRRLQPQRGNASEARWTRSVRTANSEQRTANSEQRTANSEQRTANSEQRTANSEQRTANNKY